MVVTAAALGVATILLVILYASLPGVGDAPTRTARILRSHGTTYSPVRPSERVARAIVATEDERFYEHGAIDPIAIGRVLLSTVTRGGVDPGGSTIAQQLAKTLYLEPDTMLGRLRAIGLAFKLEQRYSKPRILALYMNAIYYGHGYWGLAAASRGYFGRSPDELSWAQAALIAGLPQAPTLLDPYEHPQAARSRRLAVLHQLVAHRYLTPVAATKLARQPLHLFNG